MDFLKLIKIESKKIFSSKFLLIVAAIMLLGSIAAPIINKFTTDRQPQYGPYYYYDYGYEQEDLVINGQVIKADNPCYWDLFDIYNTRLNIEQYASTRADDLTIELFDIMLEKYLQMALSITEQGDYRQELIWEMSTQLGEKFILENLDELITDLQQALQYRVYKDPTELQKYYEMTEIQIMEKIDAVNDQIALIDKIVVDKNHTAFFDYKINSQYIQMQFIEQQIETLEKDIIENPENEQMYNEQIVQMRRHIENIINISIPTVQFKKDNNIIPNSGNWRETAINNIESMKYMLMEFQILPQEEFEENQHLKSQYSTYKNYTEKMQQKADESNEAIYVAQTSIDNNKPDMRYVARGARNQTVNFLWYSMAVAVFGVLIGGALIAREFQDGTIRLLLIRPKTRVKMLLSKLASLLLICALLYFGSGLLNMLVNGIVYGFSDFSYPNYTISSGAGGIGFLAYFLPKFLVCFITILFAVSTAFFLSVVTKNTAVSVAIPIICFVASLIGMQLLAYTVNYHWVAYTPLPYINLSSFFTSQTNDVYYDIYYSTERGVQPILGYGVVLLTVLSGALIAFAAYIFKKRDIAD